MSQDGKDRLVPGRVAKHGRVEFYGAAVAPYFRSCGNPLCRTETECESSGGRACGAQARTAAINYGCLQLINAVPRLIVAVRRPEFRTSDIGKGSPSCRRGLRKAVDALDAVAVPKQVLPRCIEVAF